MTGQHTRTNPHNPLPPEVAQGFEHIAAEEAAATARRIEIAKRARPTQEERDLDLEMALLGRMPAADASDLRERASVLKAQQLERLQVEDTPYPASYADRTPMEFEPPAPTDTQFWAADWNWFASPAFSVRGLADGIHFSGKKTSDSGSLQFYNYGVKSRYGISHDRIPPSATGRWRSAPQVELFGRLLTYTGAYDIFSGDCWSKCWIVRRQTLTQHLFGPSGPVPTVIGEAVDVQNIFHEENRHADREFRLPGTQPMPSVVVNRIFGGLTVWAELEVRFDIQLEGTAFHWIYPSDVLLRMFQWPLLPNA